MRYRHGDSDFVRVARQQDFLRALREQVSPNDLLGQIEHVAKVVGKAIVTAGFSHSADRVIELAKLIGFSQGKPLRQVKFRATSTNFALKGGSYVTSTPALEQRDARRLPQRRRKSRQTEAERRRIRAATATTTRMPTRAARRARRRPRSASPRSGSTGEAELAKGTINMPLHVLYPSLQTASSTRAAGARL